MQPQTPYSDPYDFITNPKKPPRARLFKLPGGSFGMRIAIVVGGGVIILIVLAIIASLFSGGSNAQQYVTAVAQDQTELARVAALATQSSAVSQQTTSNFAQTCSLSMTSAQQQLVSYLSSHGTELSASKLAFKQNPATDQALTNAAAASDYDQSFLGLMQTELKGYGSDLKEAYANTQNGATRQLLSNDYQGEQLLLEQLTSAQNQLQNADS
ncbi:MAG TPA: hypothetical protein VGG13_00850 [Candidatus Saccharimonadales bacterium]|jgi:hypothetical protein